MIFWDNLRPSTQESPFITSLPRSAVHCSLAAGVPKTWAGKGRRAHWGSLRPAGSALGRTWWWAPRRCASRWSESPWGSWSGRAGSRPAPHSSHRRPAGGRRTHTGNRWVVRLGWNTTLWCSPCLRWPPRCSGWGGGSIGGRPVGGWALPPGTHKHTSTGERQEGRKMKTHGHSNRSASFLAGWHQCQLLQQADISISLTNRLTKVLAF